MKVKRSLILSTLPYYMKMGTTEMVNSIIRTIFGSGHIIEFYEAGLEPHHFMVKITGAEATSRPTGEFLEVLDAVKRKSQWLDAVILEFDPMEHITRFGGCMSSKMTTPMTEEPDDIRFRKTERVGGTAGTAMNTPMQEQPDNIRFGKIERVGGLPGMVMSTPMREGSDDFRFERADRIGGEAGMIISTPIPLKEDKLEFIDTVSISGELNTIQSTPLPEK